MKLSTNPWISRNHFYRVDPVWFGSQVQQLPVFAFVCQLQQPHVSGEDFPFWRQAARVGAGEPAHVQGADGAQPEPPPTDMRSEAEGCEQ